MGACSSKTPNRNKGLLTDTRTVSRVPQKHTFPYFVNTQELNVTTYRQKAKHKFISTM